MVVVVVIEERRGGKREIEVRKTIKRNNKNQWQKVGDVNDECLCSSDTQKPQQLHGKLASASICRNYVIRITSPPSSPPSQSQLALHTRFSS